MKSRGGFWSVLNSTLDYDVNVYLGGKMNNIKKGMSMSFNYVFVSCFLIYFINVIVLSIVFNCDQTDAGKGYRRRHNWDTSNAKCANNSLFSQDY